MPINIGLMPYLNSVVFYQRMQGEPFHLVPLVPTAMAKAAREGRIVAGPVPLLDALALEPAWERLGDFCIATKKKAFSILLFSSVPVEQLHGKRIGVTDETSSSARLLRILLRNYWKVTPSHYVGLKDESEAHLLIGDGALKARKGVPGHPFAYDLGEVWHRWTGLPFVFATWVVRKDVPRAERNATDLALRMGLTIGIANLPDVRSGRPDLNMTPAEVREYLEGFDYVLGPGEKQAIERFTKLVAELPKEESQAAHT
ncbi:MAG: menaquinone biosynthesis protein [Chloroflexi bacterium]|nr:menaquinone biosynthesis protein [Chloroflexota bacterium]